jgi:hypothetical protein
MASLIPNVIATKAPVRLVGRSIMIRIHSWEYLTDG